MLISSETCLKLVPGTRLFRLTTWWVLWCLPWWLQSFPGDVRFQSTDCIGQSSSEPFSTLHWLVREGRFGCKTLRTLSIIFEKELF